MNDAFHEGERAMQALAGVRDKMEALGPRLIRDAMPEQHRLFFAQLPFLLVGSVDAQGQPWASVLSGAPGFVTSPDPHTLHLHARPAFTDPVLNGLAPGSAVGLLGLEPHTRRRNRANGLVVSASDDGIVVRVRQSFGNCPKYIHARQACYAAPDARTSPTVERSPTLDAQARRLILQADTFFIATAHPHHAEQEASRHGVDLSHRGGPPGFVAIEGEHTLSVPDFVGNAFFNTLGNLTLHPRAGLLFIDFDAGELLYLAVHASIVADTPAAALPYRTPRRLRLDVREMRRVRGALPLRWQAAAPGTPPGL